MDFPPGILRGVPNETFVENDEPCSHLFHFEEHNTSQDRTDNMLEVSINWFDHEGSIQILKEQLNRAGEIQFKVGAIVLKRADLDRLMKRPIIGDSLSYERAKLPENEFHGNLLLGRQVSKQKMKQIAASIALTCYDYTIRFEK